MRGFVVLGVRAFVLLLWALPVALFGQGEALRAPRPDVSLGGAPRVGCVFYPPPAAVRVSDFPGQGLDFVVWEDLREATFVAWTRFENARAALGQWLTVEPIVRGRAPAEVFLRVPRGVGSVVFEGVSEASGVGTNGVGRVAYNLACDGEVSVDFGAGAMAFGAGEHLGCVADGVPGADVSVVAGTNVTWSLYAGRPRERRRFVGDAAKAGVGVEGETAGWHCRVARLGVGTNGVARVDYDFVYPDGRRGSCVSGFDLGGAGAVPGPARWHPFMVCTLYGNTADFVVDVAHPEVRLWVWGKKLWRRRLSAAEIEAVVAADARALVGLGGLTEGDLGAAATNVAPARLRARGAGVGGLPAPVPLDVRAAGSPGEVGR